MREGLPGDWPAGYDDPEPCTPAWQQEHTGVDARLVTRIAREFARNAEVTEGRSMIVMGAGTNHWYHSDQIYRSMLSLVLLCGCQGVNGGGWAHYVGQEKVRPITGFGVMAFATDWTRPPRQQATTSFWYLATDQYRYERFGVEELDEPARRRPPARASTSPTRSPRRRAWAGCRATRRSTATRWTSATRPQAAGRDPVEHVVDELRNGGLRFAAEDPDDPANFPRILTLWRANLLGSSSKGHEYFLRHLLGVEQHAVTAEETPAELRPTEVDWREEAPTGKLDLFTTIDFRMNGSALYSDIVLPAATWYEKNDISSTDLHPFVHSFNEAIPPPWEARTDWAAFNKVAEQFQRLRRNTSACAATSSPRRCCTTRPTSSRSPAASCATGSSASASPCPGARCPS